MSHFPEHPAKYKSRTPVHALARFIALGNARDEHMRAGVPTFIDHPAQQHPAYTLPPAFVVKVYGDFPSAAIYLVGHPLVSVTVSRNPAATVSRDIERIHTGYSVKPGTHIGTVKQPVGKNHSTVGDIVIEYSGHSLGIGQCSGSYHIYESVKTAQRYYK